jgi:ATP-dependent protease ClpP protease subunit
MPQPANQNWYTIRAKGEDTVEVLIYGDIGDSWFGESVTAQQFVKDLQAIKDKNLVVRINSYGGSVSDGVAIYNAIKRHPKSKIVEIDGVAVSIASLIAMAGDTVQMGHAQVRRRAG